MANDGKFLNLENGKRKLDSAIDISTGVLDACKILKTDATGKVDSSFLPSSSGDNNIDGGFANSVYLPDQCFDGGGA